MSVCVFEHDNVADISYRIANKKGSPFAVHKEESELFPTKEELIKSL